MCIDIDYYWRCAGALEPIMANMRQTGDYNFDRNEVTKALKDAGIAIHLDEDDCYTDEHYMPLEDFAALSYAAAWNESGKDPYVLDMYPASELFRAISYDEGERDWETRWKAAGDSVEWEGALVNPMIALKSSPIWQALGNGVGGFERDALGYPFPPFAAHSGMDVRDVHVYDAEEIGLIAR